MKAPDFDYHRPDTLSRALQLLADAQHDVQLLAGGQSLMPMLHLRVAQPAALIDLNDLDELQVLDFGPQAIEIGSMTRYATLERSVQLIEKLPLFAQALPHIAHPAIRNRGTIGGSAALADPAAEMPALLIALNASVNLISSSARRTVHAEDFFLGLYETALRPDEIVRSFRIPVPAGHCCGFHEIARRRGDYALAGVAICAQRTSPLTAPRIVFFGIAEKACRATACEQALDGRALDDTAAISSAIDALNTIEMLSAPGIGAATRRHLAGVTLRRALQGMQG